jgi:hypothetical protein
MHPTELEFIGSAVKWQMAPLIAVLEGGIAREAFNWRLKVGNSPRPPLHQVTDVALSQRCRLASLYPEIIIIYL